MKIAVIHSRQPANQNADTWIPMAPVTWLIGG